MKNIKDIVIQILLGLFFIIVWDIDIENLGGFRWLVGWVVGMVVATNYKTFLKL